MRFTAVALAASALVAFFCLSGSSRPNVGSAMANARVRAPLRTTGSFAAASFPQQLSCPRGLGVRAVAPGGEPGTNVERTFIAIKPDGVQRKHIGEIIGRFEKKGFKLVGMKLLRPTEAQAEGHYDNLKSKPFFKDVTSYFSSGPICAMVWEGKNVISTGRQMLGATNPAESLPGTIRGDLCIEVGRNICHGSDGPETAQKEINFWFEPNELVDWGCSDSTWIYEQPPQPVESVKLGW
uniref:Nucleoside diphosphate kinase n=2 Tax=Lotharella globosa TaxID=91324 RepID=A0A7S3YPK8_9EUKA